MLRCIPCFVIQAAVCLPLVSCLTSSRLAPGFLLASTNAIQEAVQRTVAGMTPEQIRQVARLYGVTGDHVAMPSPNTVVSHMVNVFSTSADALARGAGQPAQDAARRGEEPRPQGPPADGEAANKDEGPKDDSAEPKIGADVELFVSEALVEPKGVEEAAVGPTTPALRPATEATEAGPVEGPAGGAGNASDDAPPNSDSAAQTQASTAQMPTLVSPHPVSTAQTAGGGGHNLGGDAFSVASAAPVAGGAAAGSGNAAPEAARMPPKPRVQVPTSLAEPTDNLTPRTVLSERAPTSPSTGPYAGTPTVRPQREGESALENLFPASRYMVQEAMQKAVQGIQQDHSAVMGRAMMAGEPERNITERVLGASRRQEVVQQVGEVRFSGPCGLELQLRGLLLEIQAPSSSPGVSRMFSLTTFLPEFVRA